MYLCMICFVHGKKRLRKLKNEASYEEEYNAWRNNYPQTEAKRTRESLDALRAKKAVEEE